MRCTCSANSVRVTTVKSGAPSTAREAIDPANIPAWNPRSCAMRIEIGSKTEAGWMHSEPDKIARNARDVGMSS